MKKLINFVKNIFVFVLFFISYGMLEQVVGSIGSISIVSLILICNILVLQQIEKKPF